MNANYNLLIKPMKILDLSLTYHWYDEIASSRKKEEYREIKPFYKKRLMDAYFKSELFCGYANCDSCAKRMMIHPWCCPIRYDAIRFHRGQGSPTTMLVEFKELSIGYGKTEWGAPGDHPVFIIKLGKIIKQND